MAAASASPLQLRASALATVLRHRPRRRCPAHRRNQQAYVSTQRHRQSPCLRPRGTRPWPTLTTRQRWWRHQHQHCHRRRVEHVDPRMAWGLVSSASACFWSDAASDPSFHVLAAWLGLASGARRNCMYCPRWRQLPCLCSLPLIFYIIASVGFSPRSTSPLLVERPQPAGRPTGRTNTHILWPRRIQPTA